MNIDILPLQTLTVEKVPDDCNVLLINAPKARLFRCRIEYD